MNLELLDEVVKERDRQDRIFGVQNHSASLWLTILAEEFGEAATAILEQDQENLREELVQVAAVAIAMVEAFDRGTMNLR